jgi:trigger factor
MEKKLISLLALLIITAMSLTSCITSMFGEAGITQKPEATQRPLPGDITTSESTNSSNEPAYGSKPSYESVNLADHIKVDYKGLTIETDSLPPEITDKVIEANLAGLLDYYKSNGVIDCNYTLVTEGVVEEWDYVEISFVGKLDGEVFEGGSSTSNVAMIVNDHDSGYIPGFASGIIGAKIGETVNVPVTFPTDYTETLAGKEAIFEITVYGKRVFDVKDEHISTLTGGDYKNLADFMVYYKEYLTDLYESDLLSSVSDKIAEAILANATVYSYPSEQYLYYYQSNVSYMTLQAEKLGMSYEAYMTATGETEENLRATAEKSVLEDMVIYYVLEAEGKSYTDDEYNKALDYYVDYYNSYGYNYDRASIEAMFEYYYYPGYLRYQLNRERVIQIVFDAANIVEAK